MFYTDIGRLTIPQRNKYFNTLIETKKVGIPFCQLGEFLSYCYWKSVYPALDCFNMASEIQWLKINDTADYKNMVQEEVDKVNNEFKAERCSMVAEISNLNTMEITITIEWGDWKHEHQYADYIMAKHCFTLIKEDVTEKNGDDSYSSIHYYKYNQN